MLDPVPLTPLLGGRYRLGRALGHGGSADVHAAVDERTGDEVAVKLLRGSEDLGEGSGAGRRGSEVRALERLRHPNLVEMLDAGTEAGRDYLVMTLVEGPTLRQALATGPVSPGRAARIGAAVAEGLACVHACGVVHRDVKPGNVLLGPGARVRLADFGIARLLSATRVTATGVAVGTAGYLAPEQVSGSAVGTPADVYALGLVLLEALTGRREYDGAPLEAAVARLHRRPRVPDDLPRGWRALLSAMTDDDPSARPTAAEVAASLHALGVPGSTTGAGTVHRRRTPGRRYLLAAAAVLVSASAGSLALHGQGVLSSAEQPAPGPTTEPRSPVATTGDGGAAATSPATTTAPAAAVAATTSAVASPPAPPTSPATSAPPPVPAAVLAVPAPSSGAAGPPSPPRSARTGERGSGAGTGDGSGDGSGNGSGDRAGGRGGGSGDGAGDGSGEGRGGRQGGGTSDGHG